MTRPPVLSPIPVFVASLSPNISVNARSSAEVSRAIAAAASEARRRWSSDFVRALAGLRGSTVAWALAVFTLAGVALLSAPAALAQTSISVNDSTQGASPATCTLSNAINSANTAAAVGGCAFSGSGAPYTIELQTNQSYTLATVDNYWYGPNALPPIASQIIIAGNGATLQITDSTIVRLRFFFVGADPTKAATLGYNSPGAGNLTLQNLTLTGGRQQGGSNTDSGGGGAGMGGAIYNQGTLILNQVTLNGNKAIGGSSSYSGGEGTGGGGGMGSDGTVVSACCGSGGGFGGAVSPAGSSGGSGTVTSDAGGGGGGIGTSDNGGPASGGGAGNGGGTPDGLGGAGGYGDGGAAGHSSGGGGGMSAGAGPGGNGGNFGNGGSGPGNFADGGGGGVGGGGGGGNGAGGGFGGGGSAVGGGGGFGGGGGSNGGIAGFGGGANSIGSYSGGGGAGLGGAIFNHNGTLQVTNSTFSGNSAVGGTGANNGSGYGGAVFNLNGTATINFSTLSGNTADDGGAIYNLGYNLITGTAASLTLNGSILANSVNASSAQVDDLVNNQPGTVASGASNVANASVTYQDGNIVTQVNNSGSVTGTTPITTNPALGPLNLNYPGSTATMAISKSSSAYGATSCGTPPIALDQRGVTRPQNGPSCDIGAYELAPIQVVSTADDGSSGTLRSLLAGAAPGATINFASALSGTISLNCNSGQLVISQNLTITGPGANNLAISGNNTCEVFQVNSGVTATISGLTIENGNAQVGLGPVVGGGIYNAGTLTISRSTFSGNSAARGGGIFSLGTLTVTDSTFSGNSAFSGNPGDVGLGGGIRSLGTLTVSNCTFSLNSSRDGGGIYTSGSVTLKGTLLANESSGGNCDVSDSTFTSDGYNLDDDGSCNLTATGDQSDVTNAGSFLGPLQNNGGPTPTIALFVGSTAINAIPPASCTDAFGKPVTTDQRGVTRPAGTGCDIGAYEDVPTPFIDIIQPVADVPGSTPTSLTIYGSNFLSTSTVSFNGEALIPSKVTSTKIVVSGLSALPETGVTLPVTVVNNNPTPLVPNSNLAFLPVTSPTPGVSGSRVDYSAGSGPNAVAVADLNNDGNLDIVVTNQGPDTVSILLGKGDGTFQAPNAFAVGNGPDSVAVGDFNGDGIPDLAVANQGTNTVSILLGNGGGTFQKQTTVPGGGSPRSVAAGDFNGDGILDLAVANSGNITISLGVGDGTFPTQQAFATGGLFYSVAVGDFNGDGILDLAAANEGAGTVSILLGNGNGTFQTPQTFATGNQPYSVAVGDFNGDGVLDLAVANEGDGTVSILLGNVNGTFQAQKTFATGSGPASVSVGDFNGDGKLDLAVVNMLGSTANVLLGDGTGNFSSTALVATGSAPEAVAVGDFNGDGRLDTVIANSTAASVTVLLQTGLQQFTIQTSPAGLQVSVDGGAAQTAPVTVTWQLDSSHTLATTSPQTINNVSYTFAHWTDGTTALSDSVTALATTTTITATFNLSNYSLTTAVNPAAGGTVSPVTGGTYAPSTAVNLTATPAAGYGFVNWTSSPGSVANSTSPNTSITMSANESVTANFQAFATAVPTTTKLASSLNPSFTSAPNNSVTFTATVTSGAPATAVTLGTVTFTNGGATLCSAVALNASGQASCTTSFPAEGDLTITAAYSGYGSIASSYMTSSGTVSQEVDNHTVQSGNQFCNPGRITIPNAAGAATPYASHIFVTGYSANVGKLTLNLKGIGSSNTPPTDLLLVGPTGAKIIPFAGVGNSSTISGVKITLDDAASSLLGRSALSSGTYKPTSITGGTSLAFPAPAPAVSAANYAASDGAATLGATFNNTTANGTWSLYAMASGANGASSIRGGWCVNITPATAVAITSANHTTFVAGSAGTFNVTATGYPTPITFTETGALPSGVMLNSSGLLSGTAAAGTGGAYPITITASNGVLPNATQSFTLTVSQAPAITSANNTTFVAGTPGTFSVTATGYPTPITFAETGALPSGVMLSSSGLLSGTPAAGTGGAYPITITASNGVLPSATQSFTLTVSRAPAITSANKTTFVAGTPGTFSVTATGYPTPITFAETGALPSGVMLSSIGLLSGTPAAGTGGAYPITITASNGVLPNATQSFTLTVNQAPAITSANKTTFVAGTPGTFSVTATGYPTPITFTQTGALPSGVTLSSSGVLSGTPAAGTGGAYPITITASNSVLPNATQSFTLTVDQAPAITSANKITFSLGIANSFTATTTGFPVPSISESGTLPAGVKFMANSNGTATLAGTPTTAGKFSITFTASNGVGVTATQSFTLSVSGPVLSLNPTSINFGNVYLHTQPTETVTVTNTGKSSLDLSKVSLNGGSDDDFSISNPCPATLAAGNDCVITVSYNADDVETSNAALVFTDNAPRSPQSLSLMANVINPVPSFHPTSLAFGDVKVGQSSSAQKVTLTNQGSTTLSITSVAITGTDATNFLTSNNCLSFVAPKGSCTIAVKFKPSATGARSASLTVVDNGKTGTQNIPLSGTGD